MWEFCGFAIKMHCLNMLSLGVKQLYFQHSKLSCIMLCVYCQGENSEPKHIFKKKLTRLISILVRVTSYYLADRFLQLIIYGKLRFGRLSVIRYRNCFDIVNYKCEILKLLQKMISLQIVKMKLPCSTHFFEMSYYLY